MQDDLIIDGLPARYVIFPSTLNYTTRDPVRSVDEIAGFAQQKSLVSMQKLVVFKRLKESLLSIR